MKEIRGIEAACYAQEQGIIFDADEDYRLQTESAILATLRDIDDVFAEKFGTGYDPTDLFPDGENFELVIERYGVQ